MNSTGRNSEKNGYKVILLVVVGLTAFSSAMKELNQLRQFSLEASRLAAEWSAKFTPAEIPAVPQTIDVQHPMVKIETCDLKQSLPSVELPWLSNIPPVAPPPAPAPRAVVPRPSQAIDFAQKLPKGVDFQIAKLKKYQHLDIDPDQFDFTFTTDAEPDRAGTPELPAVQLKARARRLREFRINTRDREIFLKSLNRSINLRIAS